jgi:riboflavin kinase
MFQKALVDLPGGVYFGWAVLEDPKGKKKGRNKPLKAVVNVGYSPTFEG